MRIKLMLATLLFLLPSNIFGFKEIVNYPLCGDKAMVSWGQYTCYCGNRTLSGIEDLRVVRNLRVIF